MHNILWLFMDHDNHVRLLAYMIFVVINLLVMVLFCLLGCWVAGLIYKKNILALEKEIKIHKITWWNR